MALATGTRLGNYEVIDLLGAGGMGEVYRARDTKLGRDVALKVLPSHLATNKERLDRFEREARLLASLNHPNVATLHGLEEHDGTKFLVMELVEGETLAARIARGALGWREALPLFEQVAEGLEAAHDKAVIHRDLKPPNIMITADGRIKLLDFGLAKAFGPEIAGVASPESPTVTRDGTATGVILGTAAYMSPEQARGRTVDKRTDIWAFGCCLFESLTGKPAFLGETISDTIAAILEREPDWSTLASSVPTRVRYLLQRTLSKHARHSSPMTVDRLRSARMAAFTECPYLEARPRSSPPSAPVWEQLGYHPGKSCSVLASIRGSSAFIRKPVRERRSRSRIAPSARRDIGFRTRYPAEKRSFSPALQSIGCRSDIYNSINNLQAHYRWYVTHCR